MDTECEIRSDEGQALLAAKKTKQLRDEQGTAAAGGQGRAVVTNGENAQRCRVTLAAATKLSISKAQGSWQAISALSLMTPLCVGAFRFTLAACLF